MQAERSAPKADLRGRLRAAWARRRAAWREALDELPPSSLEVAVATALGALAVALTNAVAIAAAVRWPAAGAKLRLLHHLFDALEVLGLGGWLALLVGFSTRLRGRVARLPLGWLLVTLCAVATMHLLLGRQLERQANVLFDGALAAVLYPLYVLLCALALPAAYLLGAFFGRLAGERFGAGVLALGGLAAGHLLMRDDHPEVHTAIAWIAMCFGGALAAPSVTPRLSRARQRLGAAGLALTGVVAVLWAPPNAVRLELFREPGAVAAWVLAQTVWSPPAIAARAEAPRRRPLDPEILRRSREGLADDPVVVLVTIDALRADVLAGGSNDRLLPQLAGLRDSGAYFARFSSAGSQTSVSLTSMFSCRYFSELYWEPYGRGRSRFLYAREDPSPRFPELLGAAGVSTASTIGLQFIQGDFGIARGFASEQVVVDRRRHGFAPELVQPLLKGLERAAAGRHFFYTHLMEPHEPYDRGRLKVGSDWERYLSEVEVADRWLRRIVRVLRRRFPKRGYLLVSADHGEAFGEHGTRFHTKTIYEELVAVPLILWGPGIGPRRIEARAGGTDIGPTVLHLFGIDPPPDCAGQSLLPLARGEIAELPRPVLAEGRLRRAMYQGDLKVIEDAVRKTVEVYDLSADPDETINLFDRDRARVEPLVARLRAYVEAHALERPGYEPPYKP